MKFKLSLARNELNHLIAFITATYPQSPKGNHAKLVEACLAEMLQKLNMANIMIKDEYQISVSRPVGLGFNEHCRILRSEYHNPQAEITINRVAGIIDQKSA
jgi:hypothetical protein